VIGPILLEVHWMNYQTVAKTPFLDDVNGLSEQMYIDECPWYASCVPST
jgi:hypothetical protein